MSVITLITFELFNTTHINCEFRCVKSSKCRGGINLKGPVPKDTGNTGVREIFRRAYNLEYRAKSIFAPVSFAVYPAG